jgi:hypothetical protein
MRSDRSFVSSLVIANVLSVLLVAACALPPSWPELLAHCMKLHELWTRIELDPVSFHSRQRAQAELALVDCRNGQYRAGFGTLKARLSRSGFRLG